MQALGKNLESKQKTRKPYFASVLGCCGGSSAGTQAADILFFGTSSVLHVLEYCRWVRFQSHVSIHRPVMLSYQLCPVWANFKLLHGMH